MKHGFIWKAHSFWSWVSSWWRNSRNLLEVDPNLKVADLSDQILLKPIKSHWNVARRFSICIARLQGPGRNPFAAIARARLWLVPLVLMESHRGCPRDLCRGLKADLASGKAWSSASQRTRWPPFLADYSGPVASKHIEIRFDQGHFFPWFV